MFEQNMKYKKNCAYSFADVSHGDIPALFVLRVTASSTSVDGHTWWFIEYVGGSPELPAHVDTHFPGNALCLPPLHLYICIQTEEQHHMKQILSMKDIWVPLKKLEYCA